MFSYIHKYIQFIQFKILYIKHNSNRFDKHTKNTSIFLTWELLIQRLMHYYFLLLFLPLFYRTFLRREVDTYLMDTT